MIPFLKVLHGRFLGWFHRQVEPKSSKPSRIADRLHLARGGQRPQLPAYEPYRSSGYQGTQHLAHGRRASQVDRFWILSVLIVSLKIRWNFYKSKNILRHLKRTLDKRNTAIGSPHWLAPEVISSNPDNFQSQNLQDIDSPINGYDHRCDIWSLGKYLYSEKNLLCLVWEKPLKVIKVDEKKVYPHK